MKKESRAIIGWLVTWASLGFALSEVFGFAIVGPIISSCIKNKLEVIAIYYKLNIFLLPIISLLVGMVFWNFGFSLITLLKKE